MLQVLGNIPLELNWFSINPKIFLYSLECWKS